MSELSKLSKLLRKKYFRRLILLMSAMLHGSLLVQFWDEANFKKRGFRLSLGPASVANTTDVCGERWKRFKYGGFDNGGELFVASLNVNEMVLFRTTIRPHKSALGT
jgi:hypothetical protein